MKKNPAKFMLAVCAASGCAVTAVAQTTRIDEIVVTAQ
jgi:hypothetical protein